MEIKPGILHKTYVVECANQCGGIAIFEPVRIDGRWYAYKDTVEEWLRMQGWKEINGLWHCFNCGFKKA